MIQRDWPTIFPASPTLSGLCRLSQLEFLSSLTTQRIRRKVSRLS
jgi:hypothetical protein